MKYQNIGVIRDSLKTANRFIRQAKLRVLVRQNIFQQAENDMNLFKELSKAKGKKKLTKKQKLILGESPEPISDELIQRYQLHSALVWGNTHDLLQFLFARSVSSSLEDLYLHVDLT